MTDDFSWTVAASTAAEWERVAVTQTPTPIGAATRYSRAQPPCIREGRGSVPPDFEYSFVNVSGNGNCLYHAVWLAAWLHGVVSPFGVKPLFLCFRFLDHGRHRCCGADMRGVIPNQLREDPAVVANDVATPGQYRRHSGLECILAMSSKS
ncbi:hypothetical protein GN958_ATG00134 [Phytophthora infestans]|uniref:OTU domain-containing protein n=1 Tax=Phytophthora infestans TaxID=4787 RepID=A0A8S9VGP1_PHYIN|nr:hypothetical protein GN958_ATG00134 [Phytophthora infestans]